MEMRTPLRTLFLKLCVQKPKFITCKKGVLKNKCLLGLGTSKGTGVLKGLSGNSNMKKVFSKVLSRSPLKYLELRVELRQVWFADKNWALNDKERVSYYIPEMCGIFCLITNADNESPTCISEKGRLLLARRGPDYSKLHSDFGGKDNSNSVLVGKDTSKSISAGNYNLNFMSTVLFMRGKDPVHQPLISDKGDVLSYNGNIWDGITVSDLENDTAALMNSLNQCKSESDVLKVFARIDGPAAVVYFQKSNNKLWFARDVLGRRSLLWTAVVDTVKTEYCLSSLAVTENADWSELPSGMIFCLDLNDTKLHLTSWPLRTVEPQLFVNIQDTFENIGTLTTNSNLPANSNSDSSPTLIDVYINNKMKLFKLNSVELPDNFAEEIQKQNLNSDMKGMEDCEKCFEFFAEKFEMEISQFILKLTIAVTRRIKTRPGCKNCLNAENCSGHAKIAILFSGGVDSLLLAAIVGSILEKSNLSSNSDCENPEPVDLLNVAFAENESDEASFMVPDRILGLKAHSKLQSLFPKQIWNFVNLNIGKEELVKTRTEQIYHLLKPCRTVLDDSLGCAMWFGARGIGVIRPSDPEAGHSTPTNSSTATSEKYTSPAKVLLLGTGADELLAGYARHRVVFKREGWTGLINELQMELGRISNRNLGRDDRIISDHGRESRLPFLDEEFIRFINQVPIWIKANLNLPRGVGEKLLLRLSLWKLGLGEFSFTAKRAMQFGSRIAKLENRSERADQICNRLD